jgi:hypothetical protein
MAEFDRRCSCVTDVRMLAVEQATNALLRHSITSSTSTGVALAPPCGMPTPCAPDLQPRSRKNRRDRATLVGTHSLSLQWKASISNALKHDRESR